MVFVMRLGFFTRYICFYLVVLLGAGANLKTLKIISKAENINQKFKQN